MEFMAWFSHKYIMHGFLWVLHKDHHRKNHKSWFEKNDLFFIFYALVSFIFVILWGEYNFWPGLPIGIGIFFLRTNLFLFTTFSYIKDLNSSEMLTTDTLELYEELIKFTMLDKNGAECFGMLWVPLKYLKNIHFFLLQLLLKVQLLKSLFRLT